MKPFVTTTELTRSGVEVVRFRDRGGIECTLQRSSAFGDERRQMENPGSSFVWLGSCVLPMYLDREAVASLVFHLSSWLEFGSFNPPQDASDDA